MNKIRKIDYFWYYGSIVFSILGVLSLGLKKYGVNFPYLLAYPFLLISPAAFGVAATFLDTVLVFWFITVFIAYFQHKKIKKISNSSVIHLLADRNGRGYFARAS